MGPTNELQSHKGLRQGDSLTLFSLLLWWNTTRRIVISDGIFFIGNIFDRQYFRSKVKITDRFIFVGNLNVSDRFISIKKYKFSKQNNPTLVSLSHSDFLLLLHLVSPSPICGFPGYAPRQGFLLSPDHSLSPSQSLTHYGTPPSPSSSRPHLCVLWPSFACPLSSPTRCTDLSFEHNHQQQQHDKHSNTNTEDSTCVPNPYQSHTAQLANEFQAQGD